MIEESKRCKTCGLVKPLTEFKFEKRTRSNRMGSCGDCYRIRKNAWTARNKPHIYARAKEWRQQNKERLTAKARANYHANPEKAKARVRIYRANNPWTKRAWEWKTKYGITRADYDAMLAKQGGGCALCGSTPQQAPGRTSHSIVLYVDHDHVTGRVRGLLCNTHNRALGLFGDDPEMLQKAIGYLSRSAYLPLNLKLKAA